MRTSWEYQRARFTVVDSGIYMCLVFHKIYLAREARAYNRAALASRSIFFFFLVFSFDESYYVRVHVAFRRGTMKDIDCQSVTMRQMSVVDFSRISLVYKD